jgi:inhibitor of cysteine peptidase
MEKKSMVQKEVRIKTRVYGAIAILSAIVLVAAIYTISSPTVLTTLSNVSPMKPFASLEALKNYLNTNTQGGSSYGGGPLDSQFFGSVAPVPAPYEASPSLSTAGTNSAGNAYLTYSTTNIQVAGVDEADTVKTDGQYIYTVSTTQNTGYYFNGYYTETNNAVYIIKADPQDPRVISKITLDNNTEPAGLYLSQNGSKLVVLASEYQTYNYGAERIPSSNVATPMLIPYQADVYTFINVYDVSNKADPVLTRNYTLSGSYFNSRMIGNYVYTVVSQPAYANNDSVILPEVYNNAVNSTIEPTDIYYTDMQDSFFTYTTFAGLNVMDDSQAPFSMTIMMGGTSDMYVSQNNMYITYPSHTGQDTEIYRISINGQALTFQAKGAVPGYVLNQYSMDEYNNNFRVATTTSTGSWINQAQQNNIYVLDVNLAVVGKLENLAQGESIYAARFMGDKCYLVTFKQTDPFFVIDLSNPEAPTVAGQLKIPGYSSYLHPYDANHVIGLGMENETLKLSLFDVTDINNPTEIANYTVEGNYTSSTALNDPKAFLFDLQKQLLVIPVSITNYGEIYLQSTPKLPPSATGVNPSIISTYSYWQGAYVFNLNLNSGFTLKGTVTHLNETSLNDSSTYWDSQNYWITRSLYIGNTLYTISNAEVKLNSLTDMIQIAQINLT